MRSARILMHGIEAGILMELENKAYTFSYSKDYQGPPISLTLPVSNKTYVFDTLPPFFEGLLPEGIMLEALLRKNKIDTHDYFKQLTSVGMDVVGAVTIEEIK
jgi:serine/threonine-protein kinase HipA